MTMMDKTKIKERIAKKEIQISKIEKVIQKYKTYINPSFNLIKACEEGDYSKFESHQNEFTKKPGIYYGSRDLWFKYEDLRSEQKLLKKYEIQLDKLDNYGKADKIQVLVDFLDEWKSKVYNWYINSIKNYLNLKKYHSDAWEKYAIKNNLDIKDYRQRIKFDKDYYIEIPSFVKNICWGISSFEYVDLNKINNMLNAEVKRKYDDLVNRITSVVGIIEDVSDLSIGTQNGEINGNVIGSKGKVNIETISAGGPVQRWHYRVILHKLK